MQDVAALDFVLDQLPELRLHGRQPHLLLELVFEAGRFLERFLQEPAERRILLAIGPRRRDWHCHRPQERKKKDAQYCHRSDTV
jgi:hypothetical protein